MPASWATSWRRSPVVRRRRPASSPTSAGCTRPRRRRRNAASSARLTRSTLPSLPRRTGHDHGSADTSFDGALPALAGRVDRGVMTTGMTTDRKIVLITGANKGIGFATARHLAEAGHTVLLGARDQERGTAAEAALAGPGRDVRYVNLDVTDPATIAAAAKLIDAE